MEWRHTDAYSPHLLGVGLQTLHEELLGLDLVLEEDVLLVEGAELAALRLQPSLRLADPLARRLELAL
jgi:hypothetical protein